MTSELHSQPLVRFGKRIVATPELHSWLKPLALELIVVLGIPCRTWLLELKNRKQRCKNFVNGIHLNFVKKAYRAQVGNGAHAHLEPSSNLCTPCPGRPVHFANHLASWLCWINVSLVVDAWNSDGLWKLVKKPTAILTTKRFIDTEMSRHCDGGHQHCPLEGSALRPSLISPVLSMKRRSR